MAFPISDLLIDGVAVFDGELAIGDVIWVR
jgi:hypothetical protein